MLNRFFKKKESLFAIDIGASAIKLVELDLTGTAPKIAKVGLVPVTGDIFSNNIISKSEKVGELVAGLVESKGIAEKRAITALPGPSIFTKKIKVPVMDNNELSVHIQFEAGNFIPHSLDAVKLDYHVIGETSKKQYEVLVVAGKNDVIDSYLGAISLGGIETAILDVDFFALQNIFEICYPELMSKTVALINMGTRYSTVNICKDGHSLYAGDIAVGGRTFTDSIVENMGIAPSEAEDLKTGKKKGQGGKAAYDAINDAVQEIIDRNIEQVASEINRQLSFFWNATGVDQGIDLIMLTGGSSLVTGLRDELKERSGIDCQPLNPFKGLEVLPGTDEAYLNSLAPFMAVAMGLGMRELGDKVLP